MLSRVAESLYWTSRYIERAEDVTRILDVNFHTLLDTQVEDRGQAWRQIVQLLGDEEAYAEHYDSATAIDVSDWVLWHDGNPNAVVNCITFARENARSVREQISGEMWEAINKLFLLVRGADRRAVSRGPRAFFEQLRNYAHLFQGTADATMTHGDPYEFIRLGLQLERAATTVRVVASRYPVAIALDEDDSARARQLIALLESCSAFEAFVKRYGTMFEPVTIADELIRSADFPRSVRFCLAGSLDSLTRISNDQGLPHRILGRLVSDLAYGEVDDLSGPTATHTLGRVLTGIHSAGDAITKAYFSSRALPATATLTTQEAQQQQCG